MEIQHASNKVGETSKSTLGGTTSHGYPASWDLTVKVYRTTGSGTAQTGSALYTKSYTVTNPDVIPLDDVTLVAFFSAVGVDPEVLKTEARRRLKGERERERQGREHLARPTAPAAIRAGITSGSSSDPS